MAVVCGAFKTACITAAGPSQNITSADMGSTVPNAAIIACTLAITDAVAANGAMFSVAITDGTNHRVVCSVSENGVAASNSSNWCRPGSLILILNVTTGAIVAQGQFSAWIAGGMTIAWDVVGYALPAAAYQIHGMFFGGDECLAKVTNATSDGVPGGGTIVTGVGFQSDVMFTLGCLRGFDDISRPSAAMSLGLVSHDPVIPVNIIQGATVWRDTTASNPTVEANRTIDDRMYQNLLNLGATGSGLEVISIGPDGFRTQDKDATSSSYAVGCLCLNFGTVEHNIVSGTVPAATGVYSITPTFLPQAGIYLLGLPTSLGVTELTAAAGAGATALGFISNTIQASLGVSCNDNVTPSLTRSRAHSRAMEMPEPDGTIGYRGNFLGWVFGQLDINITSATGYTSKYWALLIGGSFSQPTLASSQLSLFVPQIASLTIGAAGTAQAMPLAVYVPGPSLSVGSVVPISATLAPVLVGIGLSGRGMFIETGVPGSAQGRISFAGAEAGQINTAGPLTGRIAYAE